MKILRRDFLEAAALSGLATTLASGQTDASVSIFCDTKAPQTGFAAAEIGRALEAKGDSWVIRELDQLPVAEGNLRIALASTAAEARRLANELNVAPLRYAEPQAYVLRKKSTGTQTTYVVLGADAAGAMYGGLDISEAIRLGALAAWKDGDHAPHIASRGIEFNITVDRRSPSYSDNRKVTAPVLSWCAMGIGGISISRATALCYLTF